MYEAQALAGVGIPPGGSTALGVQHWEHSAGGIERVILVMETNTTAKLLFTQNGGTLTVPGPTLSSLTTHKLGSLDTGSVWKKWTEVSRRVLPVPV